MKNSNSPDLEHKCVTLQQQQKIAKKHQKGLSPFLNKDAGDVNATNARFNANAAGGSFGDAAGGVAESFAEEDDTASKNQKRKDMKTKVKEEYNMDEFNDMELSSIFGGDLTYCPECGKKLVYTEDGNEICPKCKKDAFTLAQEAELPEEKDVVEEQGTYVSLDTFGDDADTTSTCNKYGVKCIYDAYKDQYKLLGKDEDIKALLDELKTEEFAETTNDLFADIEDEKPIEKEETYDDNIRDIW